MFMYLHAYSHSKKSLNHFNLLSITLNASATQSVVEYYDLRICKTAKWALIHFLVNPPVSQVAKFFLKKFESLDSKLCSCFQYDMMKFVDAQGDGASRRRKEH